MCCPAFFVSGLCFLSWGFCPEKSRGFPPQRDPFLHWNFDVNTRPPPLGRWFWEGLNSGWLFGLEPKLSWKDFLFSRRRQRTSRKNRYKPIDTWFAASVPCDRSHKSGFVLGWFVGLGLASAFSLRLPHGQNATFHVDSLLAALSVMGESGFGFGGFWSRNGRIRGFHGCCFWDGRLRCPCGA